MTPLSLSPLPSTCKPTCPALTKKAQTIPAIHKITTTGQIVNCTAIRRTFAFCVIMTPYNPPTVCTRDAQPFSEKGTSFSTHLFFLFFDGVVRGVKQRSPPKQSTVHSHHHVLLCTHADVDLLSGGKCIAMQFSLHKRERSRDSPIAVIRLCRCDKEPVCFAA